VIMSNLHGIPKQYGMIVIIFGVIFFVPLLAFTVELIHDLREASGWSIIMFGLTMVALVFSIMMIGFGTNIIYYHDKKVDDITLEEKAGKSEYKPTETDPE